MKKAGILFVGGGSVGHINPLLAVMEKVQEQDSTITCSYVGLASDVSSQAIVSSKLSFGKYVIAAGKLNRFLTIKHAGQAGQFARGLWQAERVLRQIHPRLIFAKGGFVSLPIVLAAVRRHIPIVCHETDVIPGLANRITARYAQTIFTTFPPEGYHQLPFAKLVYTGQPVRHIFYTALHSNAELKVENRAIDFKLPLIVGVGSSIGSHRLNELILGMWPAVLPKNQLVQMCGAADLAWLQAERAKLPLELRKNLWLVAFLQDELPYLFAKSTLIISRAGGTIAEIAAVHKPSILVPLSTAAQNHQMANAELLKKAKAAYLFNETTGTSDQLYAMVNDIIGNPQEAQQLVKAISQFDHPKAASQMANHLLKMLYE